MGWADAKWGSDRTIDGVLLPIFGDKQWIPSENVMQSPITTQLSGHSNAGLVKIANFVPDYTGTRSVRVKANVKGGANWSGDSSYFPLIISTRSDLDLYGASLVIGKPDTYNVVVCFKYNTTNYVEKSADVPLVGGATHYVYIGQTAGGTEYNVFCNSLTIGYSYSYGNIPNVKSIQYGKVAMSTPSEKDSSFGTEIYYRDISINYVDVGKSIVLFTSVGNTAASSTYRYNLAEIISGQIIRLYSPYSSNASFGGVWKVIEFY